MKKAIFVIILLLFFSFLINVPNVKADAGNTIYVDDDNDPTWYNATHVATFQEAIDNATTGDTIYIWDGTYVLDRPESYNRINKTLTIIGNGTDKVHIDCNNTFLYIYNTTAMYVDISGIHFFRGDYNNDEGFFSIDTLGCVNITNVVINNTNSTGFLIPRMPLAVAYIIGYPNVRISNTTMRDINGTFIEVLSNYGNFTMENCSLSTGNGSGYFDDYGCIQLGQACSAQTIIRNCSFADMNYTDIDYGVLSIQQENCTIYNDTFYNTTTAISVWGYNLSRNCLIYNNYFHGNVTTSVRIPFPYLANVSFNTTKTLGTNINGGANIGGNKWYSYVGYDNDDDGIGDIPFFIDTVSGVSYYDYLPLKNDDEYFVVDDDFTVAIPGWEVTRFDNISGAINASTTNRDIFVWNGTYYENITINNSFSINLVGNSSTNTTVDFGGIADYGVFIGNNTSYVNISGFTFTNLDSNWDAILIDYDSNNITIFNNSFVDVGFGITTNPRTRNLVIIDNRFTNITWDGLLLDTYGDIIVYNNTYWGGQYSFVCAKHSCLCR